jgi:MFS family permease
MDNINWIAVLVAALAAFMVGGIWYGPLFGKTWMKERGLTEDELKQGNMGLIYGSAFLLSVISAVFLGHLLAHFGPVSARSTLMISLGVAIGFVVPAIGTNYLFSRASMRLFGIDAGYWIAFYAAMGVVFILLG